ncbi:MAG: ATP-binding cassette domain-containing protein [Elusimicrobia bacterium]|nr:ATP-binding cassette domain-containing protein [Elusimicrobiota bacterium]MBD3412349.1 ATP-binding cassette domain-containing protein [Elusimicrobiota bacterium]
MYRRLCAYIRPYTGRFIAALICMIGVAGTTALSMWLIRSVVDQIFINKDNEMLYLVVWLVPLIYAAKGILAYGQNYLMGYIGQRVIQRIRNELYAHINSLSLDFFALHSTGNLVARITNDAQVLQNALNKVPANIVRDGLTVFFLNILLFYLHWKFALIAIIVFPIASYPIVVFGRKMRKATRQGQHLMAEVYSHIDESIAGASIVRAFNRQNTENVRFHKKYEKYFHAFMRYVRSESMSPPVMEFIGALAIVFIIWYGGSEVINGVWTTGSFFAFLGGAISMYQPLKNFSRINPVIQQAASGAERIFAILDTKPSIIERDNAVPIRSCNDRIAFNHVVFSYRPSDPVLNSVSFEIKKGESIAVVGPSGAGKTTLINLLLRFYDPDSGSVTIDQHDLRDVTLESLRSLVGLVTQDVVLFNETVWYNIAYGRDTCTEEEIIRASTMANAHSFIMSLPRQYNTIIGERGMLLSGGQKQRLSIARAIVRNPQILIFDEATSSLDAESEQLIQQATERLMQDRTVIIIAHRLATVKKVDRIIVLDHGTIVDAGSHTDLFKKDGIYRKLYQLQLLA